MWYLLRQGYRIYTLCRSRSALPRDQCRSSGYGRDVYGSRPYDRWASDRRQSSHFSFLLPPDTIFLPPAAIFFFPQQLFFPPIATIFSSPSYYGRYDDYYSGSRGKVNVGSGERSGQTFSSIIKLGKKAVEDQNIFLQQFICLSHCNGTNMLWFLLMK